MSFRKLGDKRWGANPDGDNVEILVLQGNADGPGALLCRPTLPVVGKPEPNSVANAKIGLRATTGTHRATEDAVSIEVPVHVWVPKAGLYLKTSEPSAVQRAAGTALTGKLPWNAETHHVAEGELERLAALARMLEMERAHQGEGAASHEDAGEDVGATPARRLEEFRIDTEKKDDEKASEDEEIDRRLREMEQAVAQAKAEKIARQRKEQNRAKQERILELEQKMARLSEEREASLHSRPSRLQALSRVDARAADAAGSFFAPGMGANMTPPEDPTVTDERLRRLESMIGNPPAVRDGTSARLWDAAPKKKSPKKKLLREFSDTDDSSEDETDPQIILAQSLNQVAKAVKHQKQGNVGGQSGSEKLEKLRREHETGESIDLFKHWRRQVRLACGLQEGRETLEAFKHDETPFLTYYLEHVPTVRNEVQTQHSIELLLRIKDAVLHDEPTKALGLVTSGLLFLEQVSLDAGRRQDLAWQQALLGPSHLARSCAARGTYKRLDRDEGERARTFPQRVIAAAQQALKEKVEGQEQRKKLLKGDA